MINKVAVLGDSILRGVVLDENSGKYIRLAQNCVVRAAEKLGITAENFARFGMTSEKGLKTVQARLHSDNGFDAAVICFGGNDVDHKWAEIAQDPDGLNPPNVTPAEYEKNMCEIVESVRKNGIQPILMTLPPINSERYFSFFTKDIKNTGNIIKWLGSINQIYESHRIYSDKLPYIAKTMGCRLIDVRNAFMSMSDYSRLICMDGIHPNKIGHKLISDVFIDYAHNLGV